MLKVFEFAAKNSDVEWNFSGYEKNTYVLSTSHDEGKVIPVDKNFGYKGEKEMFGIHSHPFASGTKGPSGIDVYGQKNISPASNKFIYHPASNTWYKYSSRTIDPKYKQWNGVHSTQKTPRPTLKLLKL